MRPTLLIQTTVSHSFLRVAILFSFLTLSIEAALPAFDSKSFYLYIDQSCTDIDLLNAAGDEMNALAQAGSDSFTNIGPNWPPLRIRTYSAWFGTITEDLVQNAGLTPSQFNKLGTNMMKNKYSIYCDGTAIKWVTEFQEGEEKGSPFPKGGGRWYIPPDRRAPSQTDAFYIVGDERPDFCTHTDPKKKIGGASVPNKPFILICPDGWDQPTKSLIPLQKTVQSLGTKIDSLTSPGAVLLHEFTHAVLGTNSAASNPEKYGALWCLLYAKRKPGTVRANADSFMLYAMASYLEGNAWVTGKAEDATMYDNPLAGSAPSRIFRRMLGGLSFSSLGNSTNATASGLSTGSRTISTSIRSTARASSAVVIGKNATTLRSSAKSGSASSIILSTEAVASTLGTVVKSTSAKLSTSLLTSSGGAHSAQSSGVSHSVLSSLGGSSLSTSLGGRIVSSTGAMKPVSASVSGSPASSTQGIIPPSGGISMSLNSSKSISASLSSPTPSSNSIPGSGHLPFPTTTSGSALSSGASAVPVSFSDSWSAVTAPSSVVSFNFFDVPTQTISNTEATHESAVLGGLFFALQANRKWLTDATLKSQYLEDVTKSKDEALALFNDLSVKPPEVACSNTKRKRGSLSERQVRAILQNRDIIGSIAGAISEAVGDVAKLVSCGLNVVKSLEDAVQGTTPDLSEVEDLTDTLAEIAKDLQDEEDDKKTTESTMASTADPTSGSSSSGTLSSGSSTRSNSVSSGTNDYIQGTEAIDILTVAPFPSESISWLRSAIIAEYTINGAAAPTGLRSGSRLPTSSGTRSRIPLSTGMPTTFKSSVISASGASSRQSSIKPSSVSSLVRSKEASSIIGTASFSKKPSSTSPLSSSTVYDISGSTGAPVSCYSNSKSPNVTFTLQDATPQINAYCKKYSGQGIGDSSGSSILVDTVLGNSKDDSIVLETSVLVWGQCTGKDLTTIKIDEESCNSNFLEAVNVCDTNTQTLKYGGTKDANCIQYRIQGWNRAPQTDLTPQPATTTTSPPSTSTTPVPSCFPSHDMPTMDLKEIVADSINNDIFIKFCTGVSLAGTRIGVGTDPGSPSDNYVFWDTISPSSVPDECSGMGTTSFPQSNINFCTDPMNQILNACPFNGGSLENVCGTTAVQTCPIGKVCKIGDPSGN